MELEEDPARAETAGSRVEHPVEIILLDGNICYPGGKKNSIKVKDIITFAHANSGINGKPEMKFFSLYTYEEYEESVIDDYPRKQKVFLDERGSSRMLIDHFYTKGRKKAAWQLHYGLKFYIPHKEIEKHLLDATARKLYYLQLQKDIQEKNLILRLNKAQLSGLATEGWNEKVAKSPETVTKFLTCISKCASDAILHYGKHFFLARTLDDKREIVTIASWYGGITIQYKEQEALVLLWEDIAKTSYRKNIFTIKRCQLTPRKLRFTTHDEVYNKERPQAKWIWKNVVEQHSFRCGEIERLSIRLVVATRRTWFRSGRTMTVKEKGKYVVEKKERETWKITSSPPSDMDLNQKEEVEVHVVIGDNIPEVQFHYEIRQESTGLHKIVSHQTGQEVAEIQGTSGEL